MHEPEVEHDGSAVVRNHQVAGLEVAVDESAFVRDVHRARGLLDKRDDTHQLAASGVASYVAADLARRR